MTKPDHKITVRRLVKAPRNKVFDAFSSAEALSQWYSPSQDITIEVLKFQFETGGEYRIRYGMQDGSHPVLGGVYKVISPPDELAFTWVWESPDIHSDIYTLVHIRLIDKAGQTEITVTHEQLSSKEVGERHAEGWERTLDNLEEALADETSTLH